MSEVGILAVPGAPPGFVALVESLAPWCRARAADAGDPSVDAWLASSPACPGLDTLLAGGRPVAVWVEGVSDITAATASGLVVTADAGVAAVVERCVVVPPAGLDLAAYPPMAPVIRQRWRARVGLPDRLVVTVDGTLPADVVPTALALASVVVVTGPLLAEGLAWAAPCVTDPASAAWIGATRAEVVIGPPEELAARADDLAADEATAASLSRAGRRLVERRADRRRPAVLVADALGLAPPGEHPADRAVRRVLETLRAPAGSTVRARVAGLVAAGPA